MKNQDLDTGTADRKIGERKVNQGTGTANRRASSIEIHEQQIGKYKRKSQTSYRNSKWGYRTEKVEIDELQHSRRYMNGLAV